MKRLKLSRETLHRLDQAGMHVSSCWQPEGRFVNNGRKLKRVAEECDPWIAQIFYPETDPPMPLWASFVSMGEGETADEAVCDALSKLDSAECKLRVLGAEIELLTGAVHGYRTSALAA